MKGHLRKRGENLWSIIVDIGRDPTTGRRQQKWHTFRGNKHQAEKAMAKIVDELSSGTYVEPTSMTVREFLEKWLEDYAKTNTAPKTYEGYSLNVRKHILPQIGNLRLSKLQPMAIQSIYSKMRQEGLAGRTILYVHRTLHVALKHAVRWRLIPTNPADAVAPPERDRKEMHVLRAEEAQTLMEGIDDPRVRLTTGLALMTGLRRGEILGLRWKDVDFEHGALYVSQSLGYGENGLELRTPKTSRSRRAVSLPTVAVELLREWKSVQEHQKALVGPGWVEQDLVCTNLTGGHLDPAWVTRSFGRYLETLGLPKVRFHDLRHTHATLLLKEGINPKIVSERLGHSQIGITMDTYSHVLPGMQDEAAAKIDKALGPRK